MKSAESMRTMLHSFINYEPYVSLEKMTIPIWMENRLKYDNLTNEVPNHVKVKTEETEDVKNGEPNRKKVKTEDTMFEIPKLILSKDGNTFKSKLKYSKLQQLQNSNLKSLPAQLNTNNEAKPLSNEKLMTINHNEKEENTEIKKSITPNSLLFGKIKIRNVNTINAKLDEIGSNIEYFGTEKLNVSQTNAPFVLPSLGTKKLTLLCFEQLHKKYFNKTVQDTLVINNNILFMYMLTNIHCISRVNMILTWKNKHVMAQKVHKLTVLFINYFEKLDKILQTNIINLISIFEDSDYERGFLMIILSLFIGLKMLGSTIFQKSNVLLSKLQKLQWEVIKDKNNKIQTTLESDTFCSCYYKMSELIGEGSHTDPNIIECWKLFFIPAVLKITYFHSVTDAIINATDIDKLEGLLEEASNKVRQHSSSLNETKIENLIALVNNSAQKNITSGHEITQPSISKLTTVENAGSMSIVNINTPHIVHKGSLRIKKPTKKMPKHKSKARDIKYTSTIVPENSDNSKDWFKNTLPIQSQNTITHTINSKSQDLKTHHEDYSNIHLTSIPLLSIADRVKLRKTRNTLTSTTPKDSGKNLRSIKNEYIYTPSIVQTRISRSSKLNAICNNPTKKCFKKKNVPNRVKVHGTKNISTAVPSKPNDLFKIPFSIKNENSSIPHVFYTEQNGLCKNSSLLTNTATKSVLKHEKAGQVKNCSTKCSTNICLNKTVDSTIKTVNVQHGLNGNQIIAMPKESSVKIISKTTSSHHNGFNNAK